MKKRIGLIKIIDSISTRPIAVSSIVLVLCSILVFSLSWQYYNHSFWENILVEAHGMLFDLAILGVLVLWLNKKGEGKLKLSQEGAKRDAKIQRYQEEITDFATWQSDEAKFRILGNIRRLNKLGVSVIDLRDCYLREANLSGLNLAGADLSRCDLTNAIISRVDAQGADFCFANLYGARILDTNFKKAIFFNSKLNNCLLLRTNLKESLLTETNFSNATFITVDLEGSISDNKDVLEEMKIPFGVFDKLKPKFEGAKFTDVIWMNGTIKGGS